MLEVTKPLYLDEWTNINDLLISVNRSNEPLPHPNESSIIRWRHWWNCCHSILFCFQGTQILTNCDEGSNLAGIVAVSGLTGPSSFWAAKASLTRSAWFWGSFCLDGTGFGDKIVAAGGLCGISSVTIFGFHSLLFFFFNTGFGCCGFSWFSKKFLRAVEHYCINRSSVQFHDH